MSMITDIGMIWLTFFHKPKKIVQLIFSVKRVDLLITLIYSILELPKVGRLAIPMHKKRA